MLATDDDAIRERALLAAYGALILSRDLTALRDVCRWLFEQLATRTAEFDNALIRDHARCIAELAEQLDALPESRECDALLRSLQTEWPLALPTDEDLKRWEGLPKLAYSCLHDDFLVYSMGCLHDWEHAMPRPDMGKWILAHVAERLGYAGSGCEQYDKYMLGRFGPGRAREMWAERIGKKYQWIALYRLAARLSDHVERKGHSWTPKPLRQPLILVGERQLDPTLPSNVADSERGPKAWWICAVTDLQKHASRSDDDWVRQRDDLADLRQLLRPLDKSGQRWQLLQAFVECNDRPENAPRDAPYRHIWTHVRGHLVKREECDSAFACLQDRNFFGRWMPEGATWLYGFAGEYPWATSFNVEPEEYYSRGGDGKLPHECVPACSQLAVEWEYDASLRRHFHMNLPARPFFRPGDLWWDGRDGYRLVNGRTVFRDPSVTEPGPSALVADADELLARLDKIGLQLMWTLLGEKLIIGGRRDDSSPRRTFSQVARLQADGSVQASKLVLFANYDKATGPNQPQ